VKTTDYTFLNFSKQRKGCWSVRSHDSGSPDVAKQVSRAGTLTTNKITKHKLLNNASPKLPLLLSPCSGHYSNIF